MNKMTLEANSRPSCGDLTSNEFLDALLDGKVDLDKITMAEYMQIALLHALDNGIINLDLRLIYGGEVYHVHSCVSRVEGSDTLARTIGSTQ